MRFFLDTANLEEIECAHAWWVVDGVTTNPSLIAREGRDFREAILAICETVEGPVFAAVTATDAVEMLDEAHEIASWRPDIILSVPMGQAGMQVVQALHDEGIRTNATLVFSANQALMAAKAGADYISISVGPLDDAGYDGMSVVRDTVEIVDRFGFNSEVIAADMRHPQHVTQAALAGSHVAAIPFAVLESLFKHPLTDAGLQRFQEDWRGFSQQ